MGTLTYSASGYTARKPVSMASAASAAVRLPLNESGAITIFMIQKENFLAAIYSNNRLSKKTIVIPVNPCNKVAIVWAR